MSFLLLYVCTYVRTTTSMIWQKIVAWMIDCERVLLKFSLHSSRQAKMSWFRWNEAILLLRKHWKRRFIIYDQRACLNRIQKKFSLLSPCFEAQMFPWHGTGERHKQSRVTVTGQTQIRSFISSRASFVEKLPKEEI